VTIGSMFHLSDTGGPRSVCKQGGDGVHR